MTSTSITRDVYITGDGGRATCRGCGKRYKLKIAGRGRLRGDSSCVLIRYHQGLGGVRCSGAERPAVEETDEQILNMFPLPEVS